MLHPQHGRLHVARTGFAKRSPGNVSRDRRNEKPHRRLKEKDAMFRHQEGCQLIPGLRRHVELESILICVGFLPGVYHRFRFIRTRLEFRLVVYDFD